MLDARSAHILYAAAAREQRDWFEQKAVAHVSSSLRSWPFNDYDRNVHDPHPQGRVTHTTFHNPHSPFLDPRTVHYEPAGAPNNFNHGTAFFRPRPETTPIYYTEPAAPSPQPMPRRRRGEDPQASLYDLPPPVSHQRYRSPPRRRKSHTSRLLHAQPFAVRHAPHYPCFHC